MDDEIIIGIDFGSTQSGYQIFYNSEIMLEGNENSKIIPTELIFDNYFQKHIYFDQTSELNQPNHALLLTNSKNFQNHLNKPVHNKVP